MGYDGSGLESKCFAQRRKAAERRKGFPVSWQSMQHEDWLIKMREIQAAGKPLVAIREEPMTAAEKKEVGNGAYYQMFMYLLLGVGLVGFPFLAKEEELSKFYKYLISTLIFVGYGTLIVLVYLKMRKAYNGTKDVITGFITEKAKEPAKKGYHYYFTIGADKLISVNINQYQQYQVGDAVEAHQFNNWGHVLLSIQRVEISA